MTQDRFPGDMPQYNITAVRRLLLGAFTPEELHRFCHDRSLLRPVVDRFGPGQGLDDMVDRVITYCEVHLFFDELLAEVRKVNSRQYERHGPYLYELHVRQRIVNLRPWDMLHTFKNRRQEITDLLDHLGDDRVRVILIVGQGGMGKTALACYVLAGLESKLKTAEGERLSNPCADGILYLSAKTTGLGLEQIYSGLQRMLDETTARWLGKRWVRSTSPAVRVECLLEATQSGLYVILLDSLEDALTNEGEIAEEGLSLFVRRCLTGPSGVRLLITSRNEVQLPPSTRPRIRTVLLGGLLAEDAVSLLLDLDPDGWLGLQDATMDSLRASSQRVQGVPMALVLMAGLLADDRTLHPGELLTDKDLIGEEVVNRLLDESYRHLDDGERQVMQALAVFDRPVNRETIAFLLQPWFPGLDVRSALQRLTRRFMITLQSTEKQEYEYSLHPLNRAYAYRRLPEEKEEGVYGRLGLELRAADYYASIRKPADEWQGIDDLAPQLAEFEHRVRAGHYDDACQLLEQFAYSQLLLWGHYIRSIELRERLRGQLTEPDLRIDNLGNLGLAYYSVGNMKEATELYREALTAAHQANDLRSEGWWSGKIGGVYRVSGYADKATVYYERALSIARELEDQQMIGGYLGDLGNVYRDLGQIEKAKGLYQQALVVGREIEDRWIEGRQLGRLGIASYLLGEMDQAIDLYNKALGIALVIGDRRSENAWRHRLGSTYYAIGRREEAARLHREALSISSDLPDIRGQSLSHLGLSRILLDSGDLEKAQWHCLEALSLNVVETNYQAMLLLAILLFQQRDPTSESKFVEASILCENLLARTSDLYAPRYTLGAALAGQAVCSPGWREEHKRHGLLAPSRTQYQRALENCNAPGVVRDALRDLKLFRAVGVEGLEPVFELLESD